MFKFLKKHRAVKKLISSNEKAEITAKCNFLFAGGNAGAAACFCPTHTAFLEGTRGNRSLAYKERFHRRYFIFVFHSPVPPVFRAEANRRACKAGENTIE